MFKGVAMVHTIGVSNLPRCSVHVRDDRGTSVVLRVEQDFKGEAVFMTVEQAMALVSSLVAVIESCQGGKPLTEGQIFHALNEHGVPA